MQLGQAWVLVTGATGGIGTEVARTLAARGARVLLHGRDGTKLQELCAELGGEALAVDLLDADGPEKLAASALALTSESRVDAVVHSAGAGWRGHAAGMPLEDVDRLVGLNLRAPIRVTHALLPPMIERRAGHICFVSSVAGLAGVAEEAVYSATKAGLLSFADSVRLELRHTGVEISTVCPGPVRTGFFDARGCGYERRFPRMLAPQSVAECIVDTMTHNRASAVRPRWLAAATLAHSVTPGAYRRLAARFG